MYVKRIILILKLIYLYLTLFVSSIINYTSEAWEFYQAPEVEKVHMIFC